MARLRREDRDLAALTVLAMLLQGSRHTYEIHQLIVGTHKDFVTGLPRSLYHAVQRLERAELITVVGTDRERGRPERTVYRIADRGRDVLTERLHRLLATPDRDTTLLVAALSFLPTLPVARARQALAERAEALAAAAGEVAGALRDLDDTVPRVLLVEAEFEHTRLTDELGWVRARLAELDSGELFWPDDLRDLKPIESALPTDQEET